VSVVPTVALPKTASSRQARQVFDAVADPADRLATAHLLTTPCFRDFPVACACRCSFAVDSSALRSGRSKGAFHHPGTEGPSWGCVEQKDEKVDCRRYKCDAQQGWGMEYREYESVSWSDGRGPITAVE